MTRGPERPIDILLAEDSDSDVFLTREALREGKVLNRLHVVRDGVETMDFLRRRPPFEDVPTPDLILLDIHMPRKSGVEVLREVKEDPALKRIPVVVLTTSNDPEDVQRVYDIHANCYITKPVDFDQFLDVIRQIESFWLEVVTLPTG